MASPCQDQFISRRFLVAKKDGSFRPVVNLKPLNCFVQKFHFKMEGSEMIKDLLRTEDWMCTLDLKDAYLSVAVVQENWKFMRFMWDRKSYEFTCLPFGLCSAPRIFTKLLRPVMAYLRRQGLQSTIYPDGILIMHQSREGLLHQVELTVQLLQSLGFTINREKSQLSPSQQIQFLGFQVDSRQMKFFLPEEKVQDILQRP